MFFFFFFFELRISNRRSKYHALGLVLWLCWVFVAAPGCVPLAVGLGALCGHSDGLLVAEYSSGVSRAMLCWAEQSSGVVARGLSGCASWA